MKVGSCIICSKNVVRCKSSDPINEGVFGFTEGEQNEEEETLSKIALESLGSCSSFLRTFNEIWNVLNATLGGSSIASDDDEISMETIVTKGPGSKKATFSEAPTLCELCKGKVLGVENLMKAVRQQVREIRMLWEEARRKKQNVDAFEEELDAGQTNDLNADSEVKEEEEEEWHWQESAGSSKIQKQPIVFPFAEELSNSSIKSDPESGKEAEMGCDEDLANSMENQDEGNADDDAMEDDEEDDSNWAWDDEDDPDYIKSEQEDDDDEELKSEEELDEEPLTLEENQNIPNILKDPLEIPSLSQKPIICNVKGCVRKFKTVDNLNKHKKTCHSFSPSQKFKNTKKFGKAVSSSRHPIMFACDVEACTQSLASKEALHQHKLISHKKFMIKLGKLDPSHKFPCSCGRNFRTKASRYTHQARHQSTHPEFVTNGQTCDLCGKQVKVSNILEHLTNHLEGSAEYVVRCPNFDHCGHMFTHSKNLHEKHLKSRKYRETCEKVALETKFGLKCETCGYTTDKRIQLPTHVANEHERGTLPKNIKCPISGCDKMFAVKQSIYFHLHAHRSQRITNQSCDKCGGYINVEEMEEHLKDKHGIEEIFGCGQCPLKFSGREELVEHLHEHRDAGLYCDICGDDKPVKYLKYSDFREHYFGEHNLCPKKYKCGECENRWFWMKRELQKHKLENHKEGEASSSSLSVDKKKNKNKFLCDICNVSFTTANTLISHKIRVHGADPFKCDICGETFHDKSRYSRHKKEHAGMEFQKEWKCEVAGCGRIFDSKRNWKRHSLSAHVSEKPFVCDECGKGYTLAATLKQHRDAVHLGLRPWVCDECGDSFSASSILRTHKKIHTGERRFECEICGQRFRHKGVLTTHLKGHEEKGADFKPNGPMKQIRKRKS